ncbi:uncharacterized protein LOC125670325 [Ostrea edulis]|uniref:uncharacterized protein LOC125670325 n=1 Tax=Ostrea edulis TaxID=37623 RepID=UPI0024AFBA7A|nr:uncharacterized protein LOC125670325 [Ostrea edulis]
MKHFLSLLFCTVAVPLFVLGYQSYLDLIPVDKVPYVCKTFGSAGTNDYHYYNITEVGHEFCGYFSFDRNIFGQDFSFSYSWSNICHMDTDGDGRSNGVELGDANCTWTPCSETNTNCAKLTAVSHPGYYEEEETVNGVTEYVGDCLLVC